MLYHPKHEVCLSNIHLTSTVEEFRKEYDNKIQGWLREEGMKHKFESSFIKQKTE